jgi:hypothetical protein
MGQHRPHRGQLVDGGGVAQLLAQGRTDPMTGIMIRNRFGHGSSSSVILISTRRCQPEHRQRPQDDTGAPSDRGSD